MTTSYSFRPAESTIEDLDIQTSVEMVRAIHDAAEGGNFDAAYERALEVELGKDQPDFTKVQVLAGALSLSRLQARKGGSPYEFMAVLDAIDICTVHVDRTGHVSLDLAIELTP